MGHLTILTDADVRKVLDRLTKEDVLSMHHALADALHQYSTMPEPEQSQCSASNQPKRVFMNGKDGSTTLSMTAKTEEAMGVKVVTLGASGKNNEDSENLPLVASSSESSSGSDASSIMTTASGSGSSSSRANSVDNNGTVPLYETSSPVELKPRQTSIRGSLTLLGTDGQPRGLVNASTLTAFRTALVSVTLFKLRKNVHTLTVFGAGLQAYWHIYLALVLRGEEIHHLNIINRDFDRAQRLLLVIAQHRNDEISKAYERGKLKPNILTPNFTEYSRLIKEYVRASDVIFCCTPSTAPLFPASFLTHAEGRKKARYIAAIGSFKPHMQELHEDILKQAVQGPEKEHHSHIHIHHRHANEGGAIVVDTIEGAMREAGELIKAKIGGRGVVELGELVMLKREHWAKKAEQERIDRENGHVTKGKHEGHGIGHLFKHKTQKEEKHEENDGGLRNWLERGNVIYKGVGLGLCDIVVGLEIVRLADKWSIGTQVENF